MLFNTIFRSCNLIQFSNMLCDSRLCNLIQFSGSRLTAGVFGLLARTALAWRLAPSSPTRSPATSSCSNYSCRITLTNQSPARIFSPWSRPSIALVLKNRSSLSLAKFSTKKFAIGTLTSYFANTPVQPPIRRNFAKKFLTVWKHSVKVSPSFSLVQKGVVPEIVCLNFAPLNSFRYFV